MIVFDSRPSGGQSDVFIMSADGGLPRNLSNHPATDTVPTWSRDGRFIYFHSNRSGSGQVWKMRAGGSNPQQITRQGGFIAYESVDGAAIFYGKTDTFVSSLWTAGADCGNERMLVPTLYRHNLAPTKSGVYLPPREDWKEGRKSCSMRLPIRRPGPCIACPDVWRWV